MIDRNYENQSRLFSGGEDGIGLEYVESKVPASYLGIDVQWEIRKMVWNSEDGVGQNSKPSGLLDLFLTPDICLCISHLQLQVGQKAANALKAKHGTNYRVGSSADILYATSGSSRDWARDIGIPFSYTFELRDNGTYGFVLPEAQIQATCEETMEAVLSVLDDVYEKYWSASRAGKVTSTAVVLSLLMSFTSLL